MSVDVESQLGAYGAWLEARAGVALTRAGSCVDGMPPSVDLLLDCTDITTAVRTARKWQRTLTAAAATVVVVAAAAVLVSVRDARPAPVSSSARVDLGHVDAFPLGSITLDDALGVFVINNPQRGLFVLDQRSTHLGCRLEHTKGVESDVASVASRTPAFVDPCHGSTFDALGNKLGGPAPRSMDRYGSTVSEGHLIANLTMRLLGTPGDPPGPLFVLPADRQTFEVSALRVTNTPAAQPGVYTWAVLGTRDGSSYEDVVVAVSAFGGDAQADELLALGQWDDVAGAAWPTFVRPAGGEALQQRDDLWLRLAASGRTGADLIELYSTLTVDPTGQIESSSTERELIGRGENQVDADLRVELSLSGPDDSYWVQTAALSDPLLALGQVGDRIEPIEIGAHSGWLIFDDSPSGPKPYAAVWAATWNRVIAVGSNTDDQTSVAELLRIATQLQTVDEETWQQTLSGSATEGSSS